MNELERLQQAKQAAGMRLDATAARIEVVDDCSDFVGNPGIKSCGTGTPENEAAFHAARVEYMRAFREHHAYVRGPMLRDYYLRE